MSTYNLKKRGWLELAASQEEAQSSLMTKGLQGPAPAEHTLARGSRGFSLGDQLGLDHLYTGTGEGKDPLAGGLFLAN